MDEATESMPQSNVRSQVASELIGPPAFLPQQDSDLRLPLAPTGEFANRVTESVYAAETHVLLFPALLLVVATLVLLRIGGFLSCGNTASALAGKSPDRHWHVSDTASLPVLNSCLL